MNRRKFFGYLSAICAAVCGGAAIGSIPGDTYAKAGETDGWWKKEVYLNGKKVEYAYEADVTRGWVDSFIPDDKPALVYSKENKLIGIWPTKLRQFGRIEIRERTQR